MSGFSAPPQKAIWGTSTNNAYLLGLSGVDAIVENNIMLKWCTRRSSNIRVLGVSSLIQDGDLRILDSCS